MHTVKYDEPQRAWEVGYWLTDDGGPRWHQVYSFGDEMNAYAFCSYLNGGTFERFERLKGTPFGAA